MTLGNRQRIVQQDGQRDTEYGARYLERSAPENPFVARTRTQASIDAVAMWTALVVYAVIWIVGLQAGLETMWLPAAVTIIYVAMHTDGRTTQMGAVADIRATLFELWVEHK